MCPGSFTSLDMNKTSAKSKTAGLREEPGRCELSCFVL